MFDSISEFLPQEGLFADFMKYVTPPGTLGTEACPRFHFYAFSSVIGAVVARKVIFQRSSLLPPLYPNLWVVLVAPQGIGNKSSAIRVAKSFLDRMPEEIRPRILASKLTPEALVKALSSAYIDPKSIENVPPGMIPIIKKKAQGVLYSSEFGVLLGREKYNMGMIALLTDLYDCPDEWTSETVMRGGERLYEVCLTIMAASTPDWMQSMLPTDAFKGGFMSRLLLVPLPDTWYLRVADPPEPDKELGENIVQQLREVQKLSGTMTWSEEAKEFFDDWYHGLPLPEPGPKAAYLERKQNHLLKLAMVLQIAKTKSLVIDLDSISRSLNLLTSIERDTLRIVDYISVEPKMRAVQRVLELLEAKDSITEAELLDQSWRYLTRPSEFDDIVKMLLRTKKVTFDSSGSDGELRYRLIKEVKNG